VAKLMREQNADERDGEGQAGAEGREVVEDPCVGKDVGVGGEGTEAEVKVVHVPHAHCGGGEHGDEEEGEGHA